eukprot:Skav222255  [mRNA]  locus=scaffold3059:339871:345998:- [translate_table: standard]
MLLFLGAAGVVLMIFIVWEIINAPLTIVEAKSTTADEEKDKRTFTFSVQGPIVALPKRLSRLLHRRISYCVQGTDLQWLDYDQNSQQVFKVSSIARRKLMVENLAVPHNCGACKGALQATDFSCLFLVVIVLITVAVMLPIVIKISEISGNDLEHVMANNQWNIAAELGTDPMSSAFARVLTAGPKEVAMVLDQEGGLGKRSAASYEQLDRMSFRLTRDVARLVPPSTDDPKPGTVVEKDIFDYIISELGSLERMDEQIRSLMGNMLMNNLANVGRATEDLMKKLGQK